MKNLLKSIKIRICFEHNGDFICIVVSYLFISGHEFENRIAFTRQAGNPPQSAHTLKSNARNFGATELATLCQEVENCAKNGELEGAEELLAQIEAEYDTVRIALETLRKQHE